VTANSKGEKADESILTVAIQCMADLLKTVPHFNFRTNLLNMIVTYMPVKTPEQVSAICCNAIKTLFKDDESGEVSLEAVKLITKMIKARSYKVNTHAVDTFLHLRLREELVFNKPEKEKESTAKKRKKEGEHVSRKARKVLKVDDELKKELQEAEAVYSKSERQKMQSETLKFVFVTYFRILKNAPDSDLLSTVLEGLSKFAHLINIDFFNDLMSVLKKISQEQQAAYHSGIISGPEGVRGIRNALHCVIAAFQVLAGQGTLVITQIFRRLLILLR
jgi:nucleolar complex protein 3